LTRPIKGPIGDWDRKKGANISQWKKRAEEIEAPICEKGIQGRGNDLVLT